MTGYLDGRCRFPTSTLTTSVETLILSSIGPQVIESVFQKIICNVKDMSSTCLSLRSDEGCSLETKRVVRFFKCQKYMMHDL